MAKLKSRAGLRRHNKEGQWKAEQLFKGQNGRAPTENERRDFQKADTGGHSRPIDAYSGKEYEKAVDEIGEVLKQEVTIKRSPRSVYMGLPYTEGGRTLTYRELANRFFDVAEGFVDKYKQDVRQGNPLPVLKSRLEFFLSGNCLFQAIEILEDDGTSYEIAIPMPLQRPGNN